MTFYQKEALFDECSAMLSPARKEKIISRVTTRTRHVTVVLEDIYQASNSSASLRSCEALGLQDAYLIEDQTICTLSQRISKGAHVWMDIHRFSKPGAPNTQQCYDALRAKGYKIVATMPHEHVPSIEELPIDDKLAIVFGSELHGISDYAQKNADMFVKIPMFGFTESFNISVSVGLCVYELTRRLRASSVNWQLTPEEQMDLKLEWLTRVTPFKSRIESALAGEFV